ncbi:MAG: glutathione S-transferase family protein [Paracoccaceae bacterium]
MMILIGQYDSPFVRRVAIPLRIYGLPFEHRPWSVFSDADRIRPFNPLTRVPVLVLETGEALIETSAILDHLDGLVQARTALIARDGTQRRAGLRVMALASGISDKAVGLFYVRVLHDAPSAILVDRFRAQIADTLEVLEAEAPGEGHWFGGLTHADIAVTAMLTHTVAAHPDLIRPEDYPKLATLRDRCEATELFREISQPFIPPD